MARLVERGFQVVDTPERMSDVDWRGRCVRSGWLWLPKSKLANPGLLLRTAQITGKSRDGELVVSMADDAPHHVCMPRHYIAACTAGAVDHDVRTALFWDVYDFGDKVVPRDAKQARAWAAFAAARFGILAISCGGGKSVLACKKIAQRSYPALVVVNNEGLISQWIERAMESLDITRDEIGIVQGDKAQWDRPLVIAMLQTLASRARDLPPEITQRFGTIVYDEVAHMSAATYLPVASIFIGDRYGLSATVERADRLHPLFIAHIGPVFHTDQTSELPADVFFQATTFDVDMALCKTPQGDFLPCKLYELMAGDARRNALIVGMAVREARTGRRVLVLTHSVAHIETLHLATVARAPELVVGMVSGATKGPARTSIMVASQITYASFLLAKEGLDVPSLDTLILATPFKDWGAFQQCKGRVERLRTGKQSPKVTMLEDVKVKPARSMCKAIKKGLHERRIHFTELQA